MSNATPPETSRTVFDQLAAAFDRVFYPFDLAHEETHAAVARLYGGDAEHIRRADGRMAVDVTFEDEPPWYGLILTAIAPTLLAVVLLTSAGQWLLEPLVADVGLLESLGRVALFAILVRYGWPSMADLAVPIAFAQASIGGESTIERHQVVLIIGIVAGWSALLYSYSQGTLTPDSPTMWYDFVAYAGVGTVLYYTVVEAINDQRAE